MFLLRLIILLAIVALLMWLLKRLFSEAPEAQQPKSAENMRQCKYCGVHVPESSIVKINDQSYCSEVQFVERGL